MMIHDVVLQLRGHLRVRLMLLHVDGGQRLGPTQDAVVEAGEYVALGERDQTNGERVKNLDRCR